VTERILLIVAAGLIGLVVAWGAAAYIALRFLKRAW
jgi:hypothetical protein